MNVTTAHGLKAHTNLTTVAVFAALLGCAGEARCQTSPTTPRLTMQGPAEPSGEAVIKDPLGRPCLDVEAAARRQIVNPEMMDHVVSIKNNCLRPIRVQVCYFNSDRCNSVDMKAYNRVDTVLGSMRGVAFFRYRIIQK